jgi:hypothetical protein
LFFVALGDDVVLTVVRGGTAQGARFVAVHVTDTEVLTALHGEELASTVRLDAKTVSEYRTSRHSVPADARTHLRARIVIEGRLADAVPEWVTASWGGPVLLVGDDLALALRPLQGGSLKHRPERWSTKHCWTR